MNARCTCDLIASSSFAEHPMMLSASSLKIDNQISPVASDTFAANIYLQALLSFKHVCQMELRKYYSKLCFVTSGCFWHHSSGNPDTTRPTILCYLFFTSFACSIPHRLIRFDKAYKCLNAIEGRLQSRKQSVWEIWESHWMGLIKNIHESVRCYSWHFYYLFSHRWVAGYER